MGPVYTVGHSSRLLDEFVRILRESGCDVVCDLRSRPYSRYAPQFNGPEFKTALGGHGIRYLYLGAELGGRPENPALYDNGRLSYARLAATPSFKAGLQRVMHGLDCNFKPALVCAERDPANCHRGLLVGPQLARLGVEVIHKHGDGRDETQVQLDFRLQGGAIPQQELFGDNQDNRGEAA